MRRKEKPVYDPLDSCTHLVPAGAGSNDGEGLSASEREEAIRRFSGPLRRQLGINSPEDGPLHGKRLRSE
jgi:hypothetical protein